MDESKDLLTGNINPKDAAYINYLSQELGDRQEEHGANIQDVRYSEPIEEYKFIKFKPTHYSNIATGIPSWEEIKRIIEENYRLPQRGKAEIERTHNPIYSIYLVRLYEYAKELLPVIEHQIQKETRDESRRFLEYIYYKLKGCMDTQ